MSHILLDTHTLLWYLSDDAKLSKAATALLLDPKPIKLVSMISFWEISIKNSMGKLVLQSAYREIRQEVESAGLDVLPVFFEHTVIQHELPFHHRDPFDRMLVAQAIHARCPILSKDKALDPYFAPYPTISRIW